MRRSRAWWLPVALVATLASACSLSAPPADNPRAASATVESAPTPTETESPVIVGAPPPTKKSVPVARGMVFGDGGQKVALAEVSDQVVHSKEWKQISKMRDKVEAIAEQLNGKVPQEQAELTGTSADFGSFSYTYTADGSIQPDPAWVNEYIRTETVPILGSVTCHKNMIPQLRAALQQVVDSGLADTINPDEYAGCYVPRFIGSDPSNPVSLHTWGIALDLNVPGNQRGTVGEIDRRVVAIFKAWGFAWGGDWDYTDPMHFELARLY
ncbi:MAG: M15 family metallopeptidase [Actinomycetota bacterium]|nr:M15 family metallopeptidase [Actinomycetota bacterium]